MGERAMQYFAPPMAHWMSDVDAPNKKKTFPILVWIFSSLQKIVYFVLICYVLSIGGGINRETNDRSSRAECLMCLQLHIIDAHNPKNNTKKYEPTNTVLKKCLNVKYDICVYVCICIYICISM